MENEIMSADCLTPVEIREQVNLIQSVMKGVMLQDTHYGVVPGCGDKPTLLKAGAEKLALTFRLDLETDFDIVDLGNGHREYRAKTTAHSLHTGKRMGSGSGCASTQESKWRYRAENTGAEVPKAFWDSRDPVLIGGSQFSTRKIDGKWFIMHKVEHDNPADYYNTCMKMAEKRSKVACVLNVTGASDIFTQDIEDMGEVLGTQKKKASKPPVRPTQRKSETPTADKVDGKHEIVTTITDVTVKPDKNMKDRYTIYSAKDNISFSTYHTTHAETAKEVMETGEEVLVLYTSKEFKSVEYHTMEEISKVQAI